MAHHTGVSTGATPPPPAADAATAPAGHSLPAFLTVVARSAPVRLVVGIALCVIAPPFLVRVVQPFLGKGVGARTLLSPLLATAALLLAYALVVRLAERRRASELSPQRAFRHLVGGTASGVLAFGCVLALLLALGAYSPVGWQLPWELPRTAALLLYLAFLEEVVFRGFLQRILEEFLGSWLALLASNSLFALAHLDNPGATLLSTGNVGLAGIALGLLFVLTRSLWWPMAAHMAWNVTQVVAGAAVSGHDEVASALLRLLPRGEAWLTGGEFGPEGSVATLVVLLALVSGLAGAAASRRALRPPRWRQRPSRLP